MTRYHPDDVDGLLDDPAFRKTLALAEDQHQAIGEDVYAEAGNRGLFALAVPRAHGGLGLALADRIRLHQAVARLSPSLQSVLTVHEMAAYAISRFGRPSVAERWLPDLAAGRSTGAFALTEPAGGSDFRQIQARARTHPGGVALDGTKSWISSGLRADVFVMFARTDEDEPAAFCVPGDVPGLHRSPSPAMSAFASASMATLELQGCVIAAGCRLGPPGLGLIRVATGCLGVGRVLVAAGALAVASAALSAMAEHANRRTVGGESLARRQTVARTVADAHVRIEAAQLLNARAAEAVDTRSPVSTQYAIIAKLAAAQAARLITEDAVRLHGAAGLTAGSPVLRYAEAARVYDVIEGSAEALTSALGADLLRAGTFAEVAA